MVGHEPISGNAGFWQNAPRAVTPYFLIHLNLVTLEWQIHFLIRSTRG
jgi:hypothetical protein